MGYRRPVKLSRPWHRNARRRSIVALAAICGLLSGCGDDRPDQWDAFVYPGDDLFDYEAIRGFKTFELCQVAAIDRLQSLRPDGGGDYECGYRCGLDANFPGMNICKETRK